MSDEIGEAEREVEAARRRVVENINELRGWLGGKLPLQAQMGDGEQEARARDDLALVFGKAISVLKANPAPALLIAIGAGWLMRRHFKPSRPRRKRFHKDRPHGNDRQPESEKETETFAGL